jgi:P27 family predicted phage terminase small subunit
MGRPSMPAERKRAQSGANDLPAAPFPGEGLQGSSSVPVAPELGPDGLELWEHVWQAGRQWLSPESDQTIITLLCQSQDEHEEIRRQILSGEIPRFYVTANGQMVTHPMVTQLANLRTQMTAWLAAIGFSPSDRARLGLAEVRVRDELDELQRRRAERAAGA